MPYVQVGLSHTIRQGWFRVGAQAMPLSEPHAPTKIQVIFWTYR